jgi:hypothetical protein
VQTSSAAEPSPTARAATPPRDRARIDENAGRLADDALTIVASPPLDCLFAPGTTTAGPLESTKCKRCAIETGAISDEALSDLINNWAS